MNKLLFQINENKLLVQCKKRLKTDQKSIINTNVISQNELLFSEEYVASNIKIMHSFLKEIINDYNINTLVIKESSIAPLILDVIKNINKIVNLHLLEETLLNYKICEKIINANNIKYVSVYNIPTFLLEMLDKENIVVSSRNEILFSSNFMETNNLNNYSDIYYKTKIVLTFPFSKNDEDDFEAFIKNNRYLKHIYINSLNKNDIENILELMYSQKLKNIKIHIEQNINDISLIEYLKKINKKNQKTNKIIFKIDYTKEYLENNLMSQVQLNTIKLCIIISLFFVGSLVVYVFYSNYRSMQTVDDIQNDIKDVIAEYVEENNDNQDNIIEEPNTPSEEIPNVDENKTPDVEENKEPSVPQEKEEITRDMKALLTINEDTVGWLKVNNTNIDYPVVQSNDNDYYLTHNFRKEDEKSGWVFADYRANMETLSTNTIIFGHNMYYSGVMFGTLYKAKSASWYTKKENQIIEFSSLYKKMNWQIFSIYVVDKTSDYLIAEFSTTEKYQNFLDLITKRSKYNFNVPVSTEDKILTLSTCTNNGKSRLVIHAVLINE